MPGNKIGGLKAAATNKAKYGENFYARIGSEGGKKGHTGGFYNQSKRAKLAGLKGGTVSSRGKKLTKKELAERRELAEKRYEMKLAELEEECDD